MRELGAIVLALIMSATGSFAQTIETLDVTDVVNPRVNNGLAVDRSGTVYASDIFSPTGQLTGTRVLEIEPDGTARVVGFGFAQPAGLAIDAAGRLYVANFTANRISRVRRDGTIHTFAASGFQQPAGLAFGPDGNLYVTNFDAASVSVVDTSGNVSMLVSGSPLSSPVGIAFDDEGILYVANLATSTITRIDKAANATTLAGPIAGDLGFMTFARGFLYVTSTSTSEIYRVSKSGDVVRYAGTGSAGSMDGPLATAQLTNPDGIAASSTGDTLYVSENNSHRLRRIVGLTATATEGQATDKGTGSWIRDLYPNPSVGPIRIVASVQQDVFEARWVVFDVLGRVVRTHEETYSPATTRTSHLELTNLAAGGYLVELHTDGTKVDSRWFFISR